MRTTSEFWVSAYIRYRNDQGKPTVLMKRGALEAGTIFIRLDRLDGSYDLYGPASQIAYSDTHIRDGERLFSPVMQQVDVFQVMDKIEAEMKFDSDLWLIETECVDASHDLQIAKD